jgi:hypothetical protein
VNDLGSDELSQAMAAVAHPVRRELLTRVYAELRLSRPM